VVWGASVLAIACLIVYVVSGPVFSAVARPQIDDAIVKSVGQNTGVGAIAADKGISVAENTIDSFIGGINIEAIVLFVLCLVAIAVVVWHPWSRGRKSVQETVPPAGLPPADDTQDPPDRPTG
jgi:cbb3-type cytochrome oxidase subunit 3